MSFRSFDPRKDRIRRRIFPADAISTERSLAQVLVILTDDSIFIYREGRNRVPEVIFSQRLDDMQVDALAITLTLSDGEKLLIRSSANKGCGCGSRLKYWTPANMPAGRPG